jgi:hypothetical protein
MQTTKYLIDRRLLPRGTKVAKVKPVKACYEVG